LNVIEHKVLFTIPTFYMACWSKWIGGK